MNIFELAAWIILGGFGGYFIVYLAQQHLHKANVKKRMASAPMRFAIIDERPLGPITNHNLNLQIGEIFYFRESATLYGYRTTRGTVAYHGPVVRIPIAKGIYYRAAILSGIGESRQEVKPLASGDIFLTNKRVIFRGDKKNNSIYLNKILEFTYFYGDDSVRVDKDNGPPIILHGFDGERFWYYYERVCAGRFEPVKSTPERLQELKDSVVLSD